jgi:hypothetical protein
MIPFESENVRAYTLLLRIEIALRQSIREAFENAYGANWQKRLQGDLLKKIREAQREETRPQYDFARLGPLYYLTFGELLTQLRQKPCNVVTDKLGGEKFLAQLENLFVPRNAVSHSRPVSSVGAQVIESLYAQIEAALTNEGLARLTSRPDVGLEQAEAAKVLSLSLHLASNQLSNLPAKIEIPPLLQAAKTQFWWDDEALAGFSTSLVETAFDLIDQYNNLPEGVGSAGIRLSFCEKNALKERIDNACAALGKVIS